MAAGYGALATCVAAASAPISTYSVTDAQGLGRTFDGVGGLSGGGASSAFLRAYPEQQQAEILDLLFRPSFGASLQILKVEIGGDAQSTMGVEASHMHAADDLDMRRGYEGWLLQEAKARNPALRTYGLAWAYPAWVGNGTGSPYGAPALTAQYLAAWVAGIRETWGVDVDFLGQWNEKPASADFVLALRAALDAANLTRTGLVASDFDWSFADVINNSSELRAALVAYGAHYPVSSSTPAAVATGLPLWASEDFSGFNRGQTAWGAACWARTLNRNYVDGNITAGIMWHLASVFDARMYWHGASTLNAPEPWSGHYTVSPVLWAFAHTTQFTEPGWTYLPHGLGVGELAAGGSVVSLTDPTRTALTIIVEKMSYAGSTCIHMPAAFNVSDETAVFQLGGTFANLSYLEAWWTHYPQGAGDATPLTVFEHVGRLPVVAGAVTLTVAVGDVWTLSTVATATHGVVPDAPPSAPFPSPYASDFDEHDAAAPPNAPRLWVDQGGVFELFASGDPAHNVTLRQTVPQHPILWAPAPAPRPGLLKESPDGITPHTVLGDARWNDMNISASFMIESDGSTGAMLGARASGNQNRMLGVWLAVNLSGAWNLSLSSGDVALPGGQLASGLAPMSLAPGSWHRFSLNVTGATAAAALDGVLLFTGVDVSGPGASPAGWAALGTTAFAAVQFDSVQVAGAIAASPVVGACARPAGGTPPPPLAPGMNVSAWRCDDVSALAGGSFDWLPAVPAVPSYWGPRGQLRLRASGRSLCLAVSTTTRVPSGYPAVALATCTAANATDVHQLWTVRTDNMIQSAIGWDPDEGACLAITPGAWLAFGPEAQVQVSNCGSFSPGLFNYDASSGRIRSEILQDLCLGACGT